MEPLTDLEHIRKRPAMYVGDCKATGLTQLVHELLSNSVDQWLAGTASNITVRLLVGEGVLEFADDGPGLPFDVPHEPSGALATHYLTQFRTETPTADGHLPHIHLGGLEMGLRIVTALTGQCEVQSCRNGRRWRQSFSRGIADGCAELMGPSRQSGTTFRLQVDSEIFGADWRDVDLTEMAQRTAYLFPGLAVTAQGKKWLAPQGLADWARHEAMAFKSSDDEYTWWLHDWFDDVHIHVGLAGRTDGETLWRSFANGRTTDQHGTHLTALKRVLSAFDACPAVGMIHVIMRDPQFAGPTRSKLDVPELFSSIYGALKPRLADSLRDS